MYKLALVLSLSVILVSVSLGDSDARYQHRRPKYQQNHLRPKLSQPKKVEPQRRTFITALLAAEINYLEGLLADQENGKNKKVPKKPKHGKGKSKGNKQHSHKPSATSQYQSSSPSQKYVSKLDPFYMIAAPDLTKESKQTNSYDAPTETTTKYGELEHYNLKGYLPPAPAAKKPSYSEPSQSYDLPPAPSTTASPPAYQTPEPSYSAPSPVSSYEAPAAPPSYSAPKPAAYEAPAPPPAYSAPEPSYSAPEPSYEAPVVAPSYEAPAPAPAYSAPEPTYQSYQPSYSAPKPIVVAQPAYTAPALTYPTPEATYVPVTPAAPQPAAQYNSAQNSHPLTFFHEAQAEKVHDGGEWPTVYYNTFEGTKKTLIL